MCSSDLDALVDLLHPLLGNGRGFAHVAGEARDIRLEADDKAAKVGHGLSRLEEGLFDQARLLFGIGHQHRTVVSRLAVGLVPVDEVVGTVRIRMPFGIPVDVGKRGHRNAVALVRDQFTERLQGVVRAPLGQLRAVDFRQQLADCLAQGQR